MFNIVADLKRKAFEGLKYFGALCMLAGTTCMFDTQLAAVSILPWVVFLIGNAVWAVDSYFGKNKPWLIISIVFVVLDVLLVLVRSGVHL